MPDHLKIVLAQINLRVGDVAANVNKIIASAEEARDRHTADLVLFPELTLTGYPPEDLLLRPGLQQQVEQGLERLKSIETIGIVVGYPERTAQGLYNSAAYIRDGQIHAVYRKQQLPNAGVFDEKRYFQAGEAVGLFQIKGVSVALSICEDMWHSGVMQQATAQGAQLMLNLNASPYHRNKGQEREEMIRQRLVEGAIPVLYCNLVGGQDELVFDGGSFVMDAKGCITQRGESFVEALYPVAFDTTERLTLLPAVCHEPLSEEASLYQAIVLATRDYIQKNGFSGALVGLSGGIDSALTLAIAVDAVGVDQVEAVRMPSRYTADMSLEDAGLEAQALGVACHTLSIEPAFESFLGLLKEQFADRAEDSTEENIQARCRGLLLMAISNKKGKMVLTTGNKSEMAVGYATLYGDMAGGYAPIKDLPKLLVYRLSEYRNSLSQVIPQRVITRPPSAELAPDQKDADSLPPYEILDPILEMYVEQDCSIEAIVAAGYEESVVRRVVQMVNRSEYKRRQAAPGVRVSQRAFGRDRRYPITSGYSG